MPFIETIGVKNEFAFDTDAAISRFVAKRMSEFLTPIVSMKGVITFSSEKISKLNPNRYIFGLENEIR